MKTSSEQILSDCMIAMSDIKRRVLYEEKSTEELEDLIDCVFAIRDDLRIVQERLDKELLGKPEE
jgi:hypothetical protein